MFQLKKPKDTDTAEEQLNVRINQQLVTRFKKMCKEAGIRVKDGIEQLLEYAVNGEKQ